MDGELAICSLPPSYLHCTKSNDPIFLVSLFSTVSRTKQLLNDQRSSEWRGPLLCLSLSDVWDISEKQFCVFIFSPFLVSGCCCQLSGHSCMKLSETLWHLGQCIMYNVMLCHRYHQLYYLHISTQYYLHIAADNLTMDIIQIWFISQLFKFAS